MTPGKALGRGVSGAHLVWGSAVAVYAVAVLHRSSLGVAGVDALEHFHIGATVLSTFVVVQLAVYAWLQVPVGLLLDRFGSRALICGGALVMALGQLLLGVVDDLPLAYVARVLIGAGDAATFISVVRLVATWFPVRQVPLFTQLTGLVGQLGQVGAAVPLVALLHLRGWTTAFVGLAAVGLLAALLGWAAIRDAPRGTVVVGSHRGLMVPLREALATPGTWLGFWSHAVTQFSMTVFVLLWGFPFLVSAQGLSPAKASGLLTLNVAAAMISGPLIGVLTSRHPLRRSWMVLAIAGSVAAAWTAVLVNPGRSPMWVLVVLVLVLGVGGPGSAIGFDFARTSNPSGRLGTATGVVNMGGFLAAVLSTLAVGIVLDAQVTRGAEPLSLEAFRPAFAVMALPWLVALVGVLVTRRRTRRVMLSAGVVVPPVRDALARRRNERS